jgi:hypothetical protein
VAVVVVAAVVAHTHWLVALEAQLTHLIVGHCYRPVLAKVIDEYDLATSETAAVNVGGGGAVSVPAAVAAVHKFINPTNPDIQKCINPEMQKSINPEIKKSIIQKTLKLTKSMNP